MIRGYYNKVAGTQITLGLVSSHQTSGDFPRLNPHVHGLLPEGGFTDNVNFVYLPISSTQHMAELFRRKVIRYFEENKLMITVPGETVKIPHQVIETGKSPAGRVQGTCLNGMKSRCAGSLIKLK